MKPKPKSRVQKIERLINACEGLLSTSNHNELMATFSQLINAVLLLKQKLDQNLCEKLTFLFNGVESRLNWPGDVKAVQRKIPFYDKMGQVYIHLNNPKAAVECYAKGVKRLHACLEQDNQDPISELMQDLFDKGWPLVKEHRLYHLYSSVIDCILESERLPISRAVLLCKRAVCYHVNGQLQETADSLDTVIQLVENNCPSTIFELLYSVSSLYGVIGQYDKGIATVRNLIKTIKPSVDKDEDHMTIYIQSLSLLANYLAKQDDCVEDAHAAFLDFLSFVEGNPNARRVVREGSYIEQLVRNAQSYVYGKVEVAETWAKSKEKITKLMENSEYQDALELLQTQLGNVEITGIAKVRSEAMVMIANLNCVLYEHENAIDFLKQNIEICLDRNAWRETRSINKSEIGQAYQHLAHCYLHQNLWEEALDALQTCRTYSMFSDSKWTQIFVELLMFRKKFKKALRFLEQQGLLDKYPYHVKLIHLLRKDYQQAAKINTNNGYFKDGTPVCRLSEDKIGILYPNEWSCDNRNVQTMVEIILLRKSGKHREAAKLIEHYDDSGWMHVEDRMLNDITHQVCAWKCGYPEIMIGRLEQALETLKSREWLNAELTKWSFNRNDSKRLVKYAKKYAMGPKCSKLMKRHQEDFRHYCNCIRISLFVTKNLKVDFCIAFILSKSFRHIYDTSSLGYTREK